MAKRKRAGKVATSRKQPRRTRPQAAPKPEAVEQPIEGGPSEALLRELTRRQLMADRKSYCVGKRQLTRLALARWYETHTGADEFLASCSEATRRHLEILAEQGGPDTRDLRGFMEPVIWTMLFDPDELLRRRQKTDSGSSTSSGTLSATPYLPDIEEHFIDNGIYMPDFQYDNGGRPPRPRNLNAIRAMLKQPLANFEPSQDDFEGFAIANERAVTDMDVLRLIIPYLEGHIDAIDKRTTRNYIEFNRLDPLTDDRKLKAKPSLYYGSLREDLHETICEELFRMVVPSDSWPRLPLAPNFFLETEAPDENALLISLKACHSGCLGARGIQSLLSYARSGTADEDKEDRNAYTITATYHNRLLNIYSIHTYRSLSDGKIKYVMTLLESIHMSILEAFQQGVTSYRNARAWAAEQRKAAIEKANEALNRKLADSSNKDSSGGPGQGDSESA